MDDPDLASAPGGTGSGPDGAQPNPGPTEPPAAATSSQPPTEVMDVAAMLLGHPRMMPRRQVSAAAGVSLLSARRFWHALGFPRVGDDDSMFTDADLEALTSIVRMVRTGYLDEQTALAMTRAVARSADRLAAWQTSVVREMLTERRVEDARDDGREDRDDIRPEGRDDLSGADADLPVAREASHLLVALADQLEPLLVYAWRRHLAAAITQMVAESHPAIDEGGTPRTVGFADMVEFTPLVRRLSERQLTHLVQHFYTLATDVVTAHGGRVVKTIGDEVVFVTESAGPAAAIALDLVEEMREEESMPQLRVGMATGPVTAQLGDVFGTTVNRASRLTDVARPSTVLIDDASAEALTAVSGFRMLRLRTRTLRGLGPTRLWVLRRTTQTTRRGLWHDIAASDPTAQAK